ncbi:MAG: hypothetical protein F6K00_02405 [Leptolyngbya sp. SIOISBB]|nr:hypothetical protein [Leptolyngbya sp. SIOISBB]
MTSETNPDFDFRFGYTGREQDDATGLMYYRARYYQELRIDSRMHVWVENQRC